MPKRRRRLGSDDAIANEEMLQLLRLRALHEMCAIRLQRAFRRSSRYNGGFVML